MNSKMKQKVGIYCKLKVGEMYEGSMEETETMNKSFQKVFTEVSDMTDTEEVFVKLVLRDRDTEVEDQKLKNLLKKQKVRKAQSSD